MSLAGGKLNIIENFLLVGGAVLIFNFFLVPMLRRVNFWSEANKSETSHV